MFKMFPPWFGFASSGKTHQVHPEPMIDADDPFVFYLEALGDYVAEKRLSYTAPIPFFEFGQHAAFPFPLALRECQGCRLRYPIRLLSKGPGYCL